MKYLAAAGLALFVGNTAISSEVTSLEEDYGHWSYELYSEDFWGKQHFFRTFSPKLKEGQKPKESNSFTLLCSEKLGSDIQLSVRSLGSISEYTDIDDNSIWIRFDNGPLIKSQYRLMYPNTRFAFVVSDKVFIKKFVESAKQSSSFRVKIGTLHSGYDAESIRYSLDGFNQATARMSEHCNLAI